MAKNIYPLVSQQTIRFRNGNKITKTLLQKVKMNNDRASDGSLSLIDLTIPTTEGEASSIMNVSSVGTRGNKKYFVKLSNLSEFVATDGSKLENDKALSKIFGENGLEIDKNSNAISITKSHELITITITAVDKKPYTIMATPNSITFDYGNKNYKYSTENKFCIDLNLNRDVVSQMLKSSKDNGIFKPITSLRTIPANIIGQYFSGMSDNSKVELGTTTLTKCKFGKDIPSCCFIKQTNSKGQEETILYQNGAYVTCQNTLLFLYAQGENNKDNFNLTIPAKTNPPVSYQIPIQTNEKNQTSENFSKAYQLLLDNTTLEVSGQELAVEGKALHIKNLDSPNEFDKVKSIRQDGRQSSNIAFSINPRSIDIYEEGDNKELYSLADGGFKNSSNEGNNQVSEDKTSSNEQETSQAENNISFTDESTKDEVEDESTYNENVADKNSKDENIVDEGSIDENSSLEEDNLASINLSQNNFVASDDSDSDDSDSSPAPEAEQSYQYNIDNVTQGAGFAQDNVTTENSEEKEDTLELQPQQNVEGEKKRLNKQERDALRKEREAKVAEEIKKQEEEDKKLLKAKNDRFKSNLKMFNEVCGDILAPVGMWLTLCSLIPGVGMMAMIPGLIIGSIGLFQTTFADKFLAFLNPYKKVKHKIKQYEDMEAEEAEERDMFLDNEIELSLLHEKSSEEGAMLEQLYNPLMSENKFALELAKLYNTNGVGAQAQDESQLNISELDKLENLDIRLAMAFQLDLIVKNSNPSERQSYIDGFMNSYFKDLSPEKKQEFSTLFNKENLPYVNQYLSQLNKFNSAQSKENKLYQKQRNFIQKTDVYGLKAFAGAKEFSQSDREMFFTRYGNDILQNINTKYQASALVLNSVIESVPENERDMATNKLYEASENIYRKVDNIQTVAKESLENTQNLQNLKAFKHSIDQISQNYDKFSTFEDCSEAVEGFMKSYSMACLNGYSDKVRQSLEKIENNEVQPSKQELKIQNTIESSIDALKAVKSSDKLEKLLGEVKNGGFYDEIASYYLLTQANGKKILSESALLPDPASNVISKKHSILSKVDMLAKNRIIDSIISEKQKSSANTENLRDELEKLSGNELIGKYIVKNGDKLELNLDGKKAQVDSDSLSGAYSYFVAKKEYESQKNQAICSSLSELSNLVTKQFTATGAKSKNAIVTFDEKSNQYAVKNYDITYKTTEKDLIKNYDGKALEGEFEKSYPYFKHLSEQEKQAVIMLKLGVQGQKVKLKAEYDEAIRKNKAYDQKLYNSNLEVYNNADKLADLILNGQLANAYEAEAFGQIVPNGKFEEVKAQGIDLLASLRGHQRLKNVIGQVPTSEQERQNILNNVAIKNSDKPIYNTLANELKTSLEKTAFDGENSYSILSKYTDIDLLREESDFKAVERDEGKAKLFDNFCSDKENVFNRRASIALTASRHNLGDNFTEREYKACKNDIENNVKHYRDYVDFFSDLTYDDKANIFTLNPNIKTKEEAEDFISNMFSQAKNKDEKNKLIEELLGKTGFSKKEFDEAKKHIKNKVMTEEEQNYHKSKKIIEEFQLATNTYISDMNSLIASDNLMTSDEKEKEALADLVSKEALSTLNLSQDEVLNILNDSALNTSDKKREALEKLCQSNLRKLERDADKYIEEKEHFDKARMGVSQADCKAIACEDNLVRYSAASEEFDEKYQLVMDYIESNPQYPYSKELVNAFIEGDEKFFENHPEIDTKGLEFGNLDVNLFEKLEIDDHLNTLLQGKSEIDFAGKSPNEVKRLQKRLAQENHNLTSTLLKQKDKIDKEINNKKIALMKETAKAKQEILLKEQKPTQINHAGFLTGLRSLAQAIKKRKNKGLEQEKTLEKEKEKQAKTLQNDKTITNEETNEKEND